jgi:hypothetical protein
VDHFEINHLGLKMQVERLKLQSQCFHVIFAGWTEPLVTARASNLGNGILTSIPEEEERSR